jgi:hypothetical protein
LIERLISPSSKTRTLRPRRLSLPRMSITRELRDRLGRPVSILFARSAIDIRLCFAKGDIRTSETATFRPYSYAGFYRHRQGHSGLRGIAMSEPLKSQSISRRRLFWLAVTAAALGAPATMLPTSDVRAQQSDQAPAAEPTAPKTREKKKRKRRRRQRRELRPLQRAVRQHHQNTSSTGPP